jgi:cytosine/adenosine deaminase-related metal-dependent hydrolase
MAERHDTGIHTHLLETKKQAELARARYRTTMVRHLDELGVFSDRWSCAHSIWLTDDDIEIMAARKAIAVLNPESNDRIGTGLVRAPDMLQRGVALALGTDGSGANDNLIMHEAMRAVAVAHRSGEPDRSRWITAGDVLRMATAGGAAALRHKKLGNISPGFAADLVVYRLNKPWWVPVNDLVNQMVFAETGASVDTVLIDGQVVVANGVITTFDVDALLREVQSMSRNLRQRNADLFDVAHDIAGFVP